MQRKRSELGGGSRNRLFGALLLVFALVLAACGGAADDGQAGDETPGQNATDGDGGSQEEADPGVDVENKVVKLGAWRLASGAYASQNETTQAVEALLNMHNDDGGINGWTFEFTANDTGGDPSRALEEVQNLVEGGDTFALVWGPGSPSNQPVVPYVASNSEVPYIPGMSGDPFKGVYYENIFPTIPPYSDMAMLLAKYAVDELGAQRIALLYQDDAIGQDTHNAMAPYVESIGAELVADVPYTASDDDFTPVGQRLASSDPDVVVFWGTPAPMVRAKAATVSQGVDVPWFGPYYAADDAVVGLDAETMDGTYFNYYLEPVFSDSEEVATFKEAMNEYFPDATAGGLAFNGWAAAQVFAEGFREITADGQVPTRQALMDEWETWETRQVGAIPSLTYSDEEHRGPVESYIVQWEQDGGWTTVSDPLPHPTGPES